MSDSFVFWVNVPIRVLLFLILLASAYARFLPNATPAANAHVTQGPGSTVPAAAASSSNPTLPFLGDLIGRDAERQLIGAVCLALAACLVYLPYSTYGLVGSIVLLLLGGASRIRDGKSIVPPVVVCGIAGLAIFYS